MSSGNLPQLSEVSLEYKCLIQYPPWTDGKNLNHIEPKTNVGGAVRCGGWRVSLRDEWARVGPNTTSS